MKVLNKIKLNALTETELKKREMSSLRGGENCCRCSCVGPSSSSDNRNANYNTGAYSTQGCNQYFKCGTVWVCDGCWEGFVD